MRPPANLFHLRRFVPSVCCLVQLFRVFFAQTQNAVEIRFGGRSLQQPSVLQLFDVGQIAQAPQSERLQEFLRRDIGVRRAGRWRTRSGGDEVETFQATDHVAADLSARKSGKFRASGWLQIGDGGNGEEFGRRQLWRSGVRAPLFKTRMASA